MRGVRLILGALGFARPAAADTVTVGDPLRCPSEGGLPPVVAWVGRAERWAAHGATGAQGEAAVVHLQLQAEGGDTFQFVAHAPFEASALAGCEVVPGGVPGFDQAAFEDGYGQWRDAVQGGGGGAFTVSPAEALWLAAGVRDGATRS